MATYTPPPPGTPPAPGELKGALKAFRKKIASQRLDQESGKMGGPLSSGKTSSIVAITPPGMFRKEVWEELVKQGKLQYDGYGLYKLIGE